MRIAAFDIGKKNFAFVIEEIDAIEYSTLDNIPKKERYNKDGTITPAFKLIIDEVYKKGDIKLIRNIDLTGGCDASKYLDKRTYINMTDCLDKYKDYWDTCDVLLIEQQMDFGRKKSNPMANKLGHHCYSYFSINYRDNKKIIEYPAYHKTQVLGAPKKFGKIEKLYKNGKTTEINDNRKKWSVRKVSEILELRGDTESLEIISDKNKQDDMADCLLMIITHNYLSLLDGYIFK